MVFKFLLIPIFIISMDTLDQSLMSKLLPNKVLQWKIVEPCRFYPGEKIYDYMDGAGEVYLAYRFKNLLVQRFHRTNYPEILVEVFDMETPENAFGIFTNSQMQGETFNIGTDSDYKNGLLCFWKSKYFVCIRVEQESKETKKAIIEIGKYISKSLKSEDKKPDLISYLPEKLLVRKSIRYFYRHEILNLHYFIAGENVLNLSDDTKAVLAQLKDDGYFLLVKYPSNEKARKAIESFRHHYSTGVEGNDNIRTENGKWITSEAIRNYLLIVFDAKNLANVTDIINKVKGKLP